MNRATIFSKLFAVMLGYAVLGHALLCTAPAALAQTDDQTSDQTTGETVTRTVIDNVTLLTMTADPVADSVIAQGRVVVADGRIAAAGAATDTPIPAGATVIDGAGGWLLPGLTEMHGHLPGTGWSRERTAETLFLYLAGGVTTVRGMLGDPVQMRLRDEIAAGGLAGPSLYLAAPSLNGNSVSSPEDGRAQVRRHAAAGWDLLKIHPGLTRAEYDAIADEAARQGIPFAGHVPQAVGVPRALEAGQISIDHMDGYMAWLKGHARALTDADLARAVDMTRTSGTWIVPTQALFNMFRSGADVAALTARPENRYMPTDTVDTWTRTARRVTLAANPRIAENRQRLLKAMADGGVLLALGSDAPQVFSVPGFSIWREIQIMLEAGLTPAQILIAGTRAPGTYFAGKDRFGLIARGHRADLLLVAGNPLADMGVLARPRSVMAAGRWFGRAAIDTKLAAIAARHAH
ncbi:amidohydrolase family protein [Eilatimonas milleporae]|uniref:Imidazolonepropionase-like amidohydrolase n=1 Tax=Eilatimonas milleporae TaxID=911205 RepID=A0A3M0CDP4_9PROT|nr:amidohydrolase family protein [Eilatimonas milleporae]RMB04866.1 imidazolonepropionase-like amidohydrolase [Eilatimonas milleporae]